MRILTIVAAFFVACPGVSSAARSDDGPPEKAADRHWLWSTAYAVPAETTSEQSGYFSIVEGKNKHLYIGTAKYGVNAYLVEFDPATKKMKVVVDAQKEIGTTATGFAAQSKIHTRNNVGASGKIYFGTKQGYPKEGEKRDRLSRRLSDGLRPGDRARRGSTRSRSRITASSASRPTSRAASPTSRPAPTSGRSRARTS